MRRWGRVKAWLFRPYKYQLVHMGGQCQCSEFRLSKAQSEVLRRLRSRERSHIIASTLKKGDI
jgi:hypothetical protein